MKKKQPIIFDDRPTQGVVDDNPVVGEQMMDLLLHYAQSGMFEAEKVMRDKPELFSEEEIMDFAANKVVLAKAPDIVQEYKKKVREFELIHEKVQGVVSKCDRIIKNHDLRQAHDEDTWVDPHSLKAKGKDKNRAKLEPGMIRYTADGEIMVKPHKKVVIELPKHDKY